MNNNYVDFRIIKEQVSMTTVLGHYGHSLRRVNQSSLRGKCPLPTHASEESKESFSVQTEKNIWACQSASCAQNRGGKKGGNVIDFVAIAERCSVRDAALKMRDWFLVSASQASSCVAESSPAEMKKDQPSTLALKQQEVAGECNKPLAFTLKDVEPTHQYVRERGITADTARHFGIGFFPGRGSMNGRVVIPIRNDAGELIAYAGRSIDDKSGPKYKVPSGFKKSAVVYNLDEVKKLPAEERKRVVVVEGFFDCLKVWQSGFPAVVALMGASLSEDQEKLLCSFQSIVLFLDNDETGRETAASIAARLVHHKIGRAHV